MSSRSRAAAETVHQVTATLLGRHHRRPGLQRLTPDAALFDARRTWLAKTTRRSRERQIRVVVYHGCQVVLAACYAST